MRTKKVQGVQTEMRAFRSVVNQIASLFDPHDPAQFKIIVEKSTVPVGTADEIKEVLSRKTREYNLDFANYYEIVNMPEFLAEGSAIRDLIEPSRVVIGTECDQVFSLMELLSRGKGNSFTSDIDSDGKLEPTIRVVRTQDTASSEMGKLMSNAMLAQRISSMNSITELAEQVPLCSVSSVKEIVGSDPRIGSQYLQSSVGFGGSCFKKDLQSLVYILASRGFVESATYWQGVLDINEWQKLRLARLIVKTELEFSFKSSKGRQKRVAVLGFSYKKNTSDTRDTAAVAVIEHLVSAGLHVIVSDPQVTHQGFQVEFKAQGFSKIVQNIKKDYQKEEIID